MPNLLIGHRDQSKYLKKTTIILFNIMIIELMIGGGGRFFEIGPLTLRMILYFLAILFTILLIINKVRISLDSILWSTVFLLLIIIGFTLGFLNNAPKPYIFEDIKPLTFFFVLPFYSLCINTKNDVDKIISIIKICSVVLATIYILIIVGLIFGLVDYAKLYSLLDPSQEVFFRTDTFFFYKGFIYLCIGFFFFLNSKGFWNRLAILLLLTAIILTLTRGFILMTLVVTFLYYLFIHKNKLISLLLLVSVVIAIVFLIPIYIETIGDKSESDVVRYLQIAQLIDKTTALNFILGDGFGIGVPIRPIHMEIAYLEIFSKQGLLGLLFWFSIPIYLIIKYVNLYNNKDAFLKLTPFLLGVIFIYFQSGTNPYMNNPIGLNMILLSLVIFQKSNNLYNKNQ